MKIKPTNLRLLVDQETFEPALAHEPESNGGGLRAAFEEMTANDKSDLIRRTLGISPDAPMPAVVKEASDMLGLNTTDSSLHDASISSSKDFPKSTEEAQSREQCLLKDMEYLSPV